MTNGSKEVDAVLERETAIGFAAIAALAWSQAESESDRLKQLRPLMRAAAWTARARRHHGLAPLSISALIEALDEPMGTWLPGAVGGPLLEDGEPTVACEEYADEAGVAPPMEVEQRVILAALQECAQRPDGAEAYTAFRRFLIENAHSDRASAARTVARVGVQLAHVYERIPETATLSHDGERVFYPCPRCGWPMGCLRDRVACHRSDECVRAGADFLVSGAGVLTPHRGTEPPAAVPVADRVSLRPGVWRYTLIPGLVELELERRLKQIDGVEVAMWPDLDTYDLDVRRGERRWKIDVKDYRSAAVLARRLNETAGTDDLWIVVADNKRDQVTRLRRLVASGYHFATVSQMVALVRKTDA